MSNPEIEKNLVLVLLDWENIKKNIEITSPGEFSLTAGFKKCADWIKKIGEPFGMYAFAPQHELFLVDKPLYEHNFVLIYCPKIKENDEEIDTTDGTLKREGEKLINSVPGITHVILGSADHGFAPMLESAKRKKGVKIGAIVGNPERINIEIYNLIDTYSGTERKMIHVFSPKLEDM